MAIVIRHAFTVDVEEWYDGIPIDETQKSSAEDRLSHSLDLLLMIMEKNRTKGTFFWLGSVACRYPDIVRRVSESGHEIGCHGWSHDFVHNLSPAKFRRETENALGVLMDIVGKPVVAYRAPYFSITKKTMWALEIAASLGIRYDSSIFPIQNWRYGIPGFDPRPQHLQTRNGSICVVPISVRKIWGLNIPVGGGAYFRIYPYSLTRSNFVKAERERLPVTFYIHTWEVDPGHPRIPFQWKAKLTHYFNLRSTEVKLRRLLCDFSFAPLSEVVDDYWQSCLR